MMFMDTQIGYDWGDEDEEKDVWLVKSNPGIRERKVNNRNSSREIIAWLRQ